MARQLCAGHAFWSPKFLVDSGCVLAEPTVGWDANMGIIGSPSIKCPSYSHHSQLSCSNPPPSEFGFGPSIPEPPSSAVRVGGC